MAEGSDSENDDFGSKFDRIDWADEMERLESNKISSQTKKTLASVPQMPLPQNEIIKDEENNIRNEITYRYNKKGEIEKVTKVIRIVKERVPLGIAIRKKWKKFGQAAHDSEGVDAATTKCGDEIFLNLTTKKDELDMNVTHESGLKGVLQSLEKIKDEEPSVTNNNISSKPTDTYIPSYKRINGIPGSSSGYQEDLPSVKISNISLDTTEDDLNELLKNFGKIQRLHMPKDRLKGQSKGVAFVTFQLRSAAAQVVKKLNGYAYDHLILKVEWSKPQIKRNVV